jgi:hypothetical protein
MRVSTFLNTKLSRARKFIKKTLTLFIIPIICLSCILILSLIAYAAQLGVMYFTPTLVTLGNYSQSPGIAPPEIDLTGIPSEGIVSRRHARVDWDWSQNAYMIVDMSTNGIYLNNNSLTPGMQYRLLNGDVLRFGQDNLVNFTIYVVY